MGRLESWLNEEPYELEVPALIAKGLIVSFLYMILITSVYHFLKIDVRIWGHNSGTPINSELPFLMLWVAFIEEIIFRVPLVIPMMFKAGTGTVVFCAVALSSIFGILHGSLMNIPIQGVLGFIFSLMFIKCCKERGNLGKALLTSTAIHYSYNMTLIAVAYAGGVRTF